MSHQLEFDFDPPEAACCSVCDNYDDLILTDDGEPLCPSCHKIYEEEIRELEELANEDNK